MDSMELQKKMENALSSIREVLIIAHKQIRDELLIYESLFLSKPKKEYIGKYTGFTGYYVWPCPSTKNGMVRNPRNNDYRNYIWVTVENAVTAEKCFINLFYNNVDPSTGNPHTQFGRIQFGRGGSKFDNNNGKPSEKSEASSHERIALNPVPKSGGKDGYGTLYFHGEKYSDAGQAIFMGTFNPENLVKDFINFLNSTK